MKNLLFTFMNTMMFEWQFSDGTKIALFDYEYFVKLVLKIFVYISGILITKMSL